MNLNVSSETAGFIQRLPKAETHLHIEGALPYDLLRELEPGVHPDVQECWAADFRWKCFEDFENHLIAHAMKWYTTPERYYEAAKVVFERQRAQNVRYVETSFHAGMIEFLGIPGPEILAAIRAAAPVDMTVRVFMGMSRNCYSEILAPVVEECMTWNGLAGIDLHGIEYLPLEGWTPKLWQKARDAGLETKAHAGEFGPAAHVREAIEVLGSKRIQHGVRAIEDADVLQHAIDQDVTFDVCPISNIKLAVIDSIEVHPLRKFFDRGLRCTISTDDPFSFGNTIEDEYKAVSAGLAFSHEELAQLSRNAFDVALVDDATRASWIAEVDAALC